MALDYPPAEHFLRDLRFAFDDVEEADPEFRARFPIVPELGDAGGNLRLGAVATLVDLIGGGLIGRAVAPNWMATLDLTVHAIAPVPVATGGIVTATGRCLRAGRSTGVVEVDLEVGGSVIGIGSTTFAVLERRDSNPVLDPGPSGTGIHLEPGSGFARPLIDVLGIRAGDEPGSVEVNKLPYIQNSLDAVQGGALATLIEAGAHAALPTGSPRTAVALEVNYLSLVKRSPARTHGRVLQHDADRSVVEVRVLDHGNRDRVTTAGRVVLVPGERR